ncbi:MAG TPA: cysteine desulfurase-like protein [Pseudonocardiaceae bacterium]|jgi:cysteine desulfurase family protein (TIGR01976 family)|nr:cysteine desulfurase-like protein [Pseudonocardiaceae bacterium]
MAADRRYDIDALRGHFPALADGAAHFDGPGGSQVPDVVADAVRDTLTSAIANRGRITAAERTAETTVREARAAMADLLAADPRGIVFGRSMTQLTYDFARTLAKTWRPGDNIVVTRLDHDANIRPWVQAAEAVGVAVRWAEFEPATGELTEEHVAAHLSPRTRLVAVTGASNLIGTRPPLAAITGLAHEAGAYTYVDGVHLTAHLPVDVAALGADFFACSPYKFLGPHCGVLAADPDLLATLHPDKLLPATDAVPERFELGTLPYELLAGTTAAVTFLASLASSAGDRRTRLVGSMTAIAEHEDRLRHTIETRLADLPGITCHSRASSRTPTLLLTFDDRPAADLSADESPAANRSAAEAYAFLAERGVNAPAGSFYALEASRWLGLGDTGGLRIGLAPYSNSDDVDRLLDGLTEFVAK